MIDYEGTLERWKNKTSFDGIIKMGLKVEDYLTIKHALETAAAISTKVTSAGEITEDGIMRNTPWNG